LKFPGAGNFAANFLNLKLENSKLRPKPTKLATPAGNGAGNIGNLAASVCRHSSYMPFFGEDREPIREKAGNAGPYCGVATSKGRRRPFLHWSPQSFSTASAAGGSLIVLQ
jgi:hypothetical protein